MSDHKFISLRSVYKSYDRNTKILEDFNLDIEEGSFVSILGPSGSGKSTVLNLIGGFIRPDKGKILINGVDVKDIPPNHRPTATVFQNYALFPHMNVFDNIAYGLKKMFVYKEDVDESFYLLVERLYGESVRKASKKLSFLKKKISIVNNKKQRIIDRFEFFGKNKFLSFIRNILINNYELKLIDLDYWISYWEYYSIIAKKKYVDKYIKRPLKKQEINDRVLKIINMVGLNGKEKYNPVSLSGGQQQRAALARAIITEPKILLLDEPLSALDEVVREKLQLELKKLHKRLNITFILITHNQEEALMLSDKIVVIRGGKIEQIGTPSELYDAPINTWVADFMGKANIFSGVYIRSGVILVENKEFTTDVVDGFESGEEVYVMIRPEDYDVVDVDRGIVSVQVVDSIYKGQLWEIKCKFMNNVIYVENIDEVEIGKEVGLIWDSIDVHVMKK